MKEQEAKKIAKDILSYYLGEAWHDLDNPYYSERLEPYEKEMVKFYIHLYGQRASRMMKIPYEPH